MKSMCQDERRSSPSVTVCRPASRWSSITSRIASSSAAFSAAASMRPALKAARASWSAGGRNRLPTWSARNGGNWAMWEGAFPSPRNRIPSRVMGFDEAGDATRRTRLANERTYLAWWRTGLTAFAVSLGAGKLVPALTDAARWPYALVGVGFALLGVAFIGYGYRRQLMVERAVARGEYVRPDE